jgi:ADP-heptose:LPS heptosyltransferase
VWTVNIAVVVAGTRGDLLQVTPLLRTLTASYPEANVILFGPCSALPISSGIAEPPRCFYPRSLDVPPKHPAWLRLLTVLRRERIDVVYLCTTKTYVRVAAYLSGIGLRLGLGGGWSSIFLSDRHHSRNVAANPAAELVHLAALQGAQTLVGQADYTPAPANTEQAEHEVRVLAGLDRANGPLIAISPTAGGKSADAWPPDRFAHLANSLSTRHGAEILLLGREECRPVVDAIKMDLSAPPTDRCGEIDWDQTAALLSKCDLCVSNDVEMLQLADAVGTSTVGLFGKTPARTHAPHGSQHRAIQSVSKRIDAIRVEDVLASIESV